MDLGSVSILGLILSLLSFFMATRNWKLMMSKLEIRAMETVCNLKLQWAMIGEEIPIPKAMSTASSSFFCWWSAHM